VFFNFFFIGPLYFLALSIIGIRGSLRDEASPATA
jgi:hypothetical protein